MVGLTEIRASNTALKTLPSGQNQVSVFVGGTAGIGLATIEALALNTVTPTVYIVGRSAASFAPQLEALRALNPAGKFTFIEAQASLLKEVDRASKEIQAKEQKIDLLFLSIGALSFNGRQDTPDGLPLFLALSVYARLRFINNLLPQLSQSPHPRVVSILAAGDEGVIDTDDLALKTHHSLTSELTHGSTINSLALEELSKANPKVSFIHAHPGVVNTDLLGKLLGQATGWKYVLGAIASWTVLPIVKLFITTPKEAGERALYEATSERFAVREGAGFFRVDPAQEPAKRVEQLEKYRADGVSKKVWDQTLGIFEAAGSA